jgi:hypothetical protein
MKKYSKKYSKKHTKKTHKTKQTHKKTKTKKTIKKIVFNKKTGRKIMRGGGEMIGGFVNMVEYLKDFEPDPLTTNSSIPRIIDYVDYHGAEISILARWQQLGSSLIDKKSEKTYLSPDSSGVLSVKTYYDFDDFTEFVIQSLKNIEKSIYQALKNTDATKTEFYCLSMLARYNNLSVYPYYLHTKTSMIDIDIDV